MPNIASLTLCCFTPASGQDEQRSGPLHHRFFFNLSAITNKEKVKKAELRIFKKKPHTQSIEGNFMIRLFRLDISYNKSSQLQKNNGVFVTSRLVSNKEKVGRWISLDITSVVKLWTEAKTGQNFGIRLSVQGFNAFSKDFRIGNRGRRAPFLVTYTEDPQVGIELTKSLINCTNSQVIERNDYSPNNTSTVARNRAKRSSLQRCRKRWAYVSFKKLKWDWIVAPKGYSANYCEGICTTNLDITLNPTNHAILQSILHRMDSRIPSPSCVPTKLHSISVLYRTSDRSVALTEYGGMIVSSCGCH